MHWVETETFKRPDGSMCKFSEASLWDRTVAVITFKDFKVGKWEAKGKDAVKFKHDYAGLFQNFRGGHLHYTHYMFEMIRKIMYVASSVFHADPKLSDRAWACGSTLFFLAFLYNMPVVQTVILSVYSTVSAVLTLNESPYK